MQALRAENAKLQQLASNTVAVKADLERQISDGDGQIKVKLGVPAHSRVACKHKVGTWLASRLNRLDMAVTQ